MRLFTAIEIPGIGKDNVKDNLRALLDRLRPAAKLSWTPVDNLHITTKFIGEWPEGRLEELKRALESVGSPGAPERFRSPGEVDRLHSPGEVERLRPPGEVNVRISGVGWFPIARNPRVLWAGVSGGEKSAGEPLKSLAHATEVAVHTIGVAKDDREYSPHLTLARIRQGVRLDMLRRAIDSLESTEFGSFVASAFHLYLSAGGKYTKLAQFGLT